MTPPAETTQDWARRQWRAWTLQGDLDSLVPMLVYTAGGLMLLGAVITKAARKRRSR
jgi:hypothetical protein